MYVSKQYLEHMPTASNGYFYKRNYERLHILGCFSLNNSTYFSYKNNNKNILNLPLSLS